MSNPITISIPHELGKAEARRRIEQGFGSIEQQLGAAALKMTFTERWEGDRLHFTGRTMGQTVSGQVDVSEDSVLVKVTLPRLLAALADKVRGRLAAQGTKLLEKK